MRKVNIENDLVKIQKKLIELTERWLKIRNCGKFGEPSIYIGLDDELKWFAEIYSYQMDFEDGGRHHFFYADTYEKLIKKLWNVIKKEEKNLERQEKRKG